MTVSRDFEIKCDGCGKSFTADVLYAHELDARYRYDKRIVVHYGYKDTKEYEMPDTHFCEKCKKLKDDKLHSTLVDLGFVEKPKNIF